MLTPAEVARYLSHDTKEVRDHALHSLALAGERSEIKADLPLATLGQLGLGAFSDPTLIAQLPPSPEVATKSFAAAANSTLPARNIAAILLQELPTALLLANRDLVRTLPAGALRTCLEHRLALAQLSPDQLWQQLLASADPAKTHDLILALIPHDSAVGPLVSGFLARNAPAAGEAAVIELAGRTHLATVVNALVDRLARAEPAVAEAAEAALGRLGTAGAATVLEQRCNLASATPAFRLHAARAMARFRIPSVEATVLRLVVEEDDPAALCALCTALADICTTTGFPRLSEIVSSGRCGAQTASLKRSIAALEVMIRSAAAKSAPTHHAPAPAGPQATSAASTATLPPTPTGGPLLSTLGSGDFSAIEVPDPELAPPADELPLMEIPDEMPAPASAPAPSQAKPQQLRRDAAQVGRNDPCPCGSGKKYKKCCGA